jgi:hypothetical protein
MIEILDTIDSNLLYEEYSKIEHHIDWYITGQQGRQTCIQTRPDQPLGLDGCGSVDPTTSITSYNYLNPLIENTIWAELIEKHKAKIIEMPAFAGIAGPGQAFALPLHTDPATFGCSE